MDTQTHLQAHLHTYSTYTFMGQFSSYISLTIYLLYFTPGNFRKQTLKNSQFYTWEATICFLTHTGQGLIWGTELLCEWAGILSMFSWAEPCKGPTDARKLLST